MSIADRLREERHRLNLTQTEAANACGISFATYQGYERGVRFPTADTLESLFRTGFDVLYVVTGGRNTSTLSNEQSAVLTALGQLDDRARKAVVAGLLCQVETYNSTID